MTPPSPSRILAEILSYDLAGGTVQLRSLEGEILESPLPSRLMGSEQSPRARQILDEVMRAMHPPGWRVVLEGCGPTSAGATGVRQVLPERFSWAGVGEPELA